MYVKVSFTFTINILVFRICLFVFNSLFLGFGNLKILVSKIISHMANYFRNENFGILKIKYNKNLIYSVINSWYRKTLFEFIINIITFRFFLFVFNPLFVSFLNFKILISKIISHMGEDFWKTNFLISTKILSLFK